MQRRGFRLPEACVLRRLLAQPHDWAIGESIGAAQAVGIVERQKRDKKPPTGADLSAERKHKEKSICTDTGHSITVYYMPEIPILVGFIPQDVNIIFRFIKAVRDCILTKIHGFGNII